MTAFWEDGEAKKTQRHIQWLFIKKFCHSLCAIILRKVKKIVIVATSSLLASSSSSSSCWVNEKRKKCLRRLLWTRTVCVPSSVRAFKITKPSKIIVFITVKSIKKWHFFRACLCFCTRFSLCKTFHTFHRLGISILATRYENAS